MKVLKTSNQNMITKKQKIAGILTMSRNGVLFIDHLDKLGESKSFSLSNCKDFFFFFKNFNKIKYSKLWKMENMEPKIK